MPRNSAPAFQFYPKDWLSDKNVKRLSYHTKGVYIELLAIMWNEGKDCIENDNDLATILSLDKDSWKVTYAELQKEGKKVFIENNGFLISKRLRAERKKQQAWRDKCSKGGRASAKARWGKEIDENKESKGSYDLVTRPLQVKGNSSSSSSSSSSTSKKEGKKETPPPKLTFEENVKLSQTEYDKLITEYGQLAADKMIEKLGNHKGAKGQSYKSDYRAIRNWVVEWWAKEGAALYRPKQTTLERIEEAEAKGEIHHAEI